MWNNTLVINQVLIRGLLFNEKRVETLLSFVVVLLYLGLLNHTARTSARACRMAILGNMFRCGFSDPWAAYHLCPSSRN